MRSSAIVSLVALGVAGSCTVDRPDFIKHCPPGWTADGKNCLEPNGGAGGAASGGSAGAESAAGAESSDGGAAGGDADACDSAGDPTVESCLISDAYSIFVAPAGSDTADGTMSSPVQSVSRAIQLAEARHVSHILVCRATFNEKLELGEEASGLSIHGGFACPGDVSPWTPTGRSRFAPITAGAALQVNSASDIRITDIDFESQDAIEQGESSIGGIIVDSTSVELVRVSLSAGLGTAGSDGEESEFGFNSADTLNGNDPSDGTGAAEKECTCPAGDQSVGGAGSDGGSAEPGEPGYPALGGGQPGQPGSCGTTPGSDGADAPAAADGVGAARAGEIVGGAWIPEPGTVGEDGTVGQGGGGAAGGNLDGAGSGGCGSCGGKGGAPGRGGGASIALLVSNSTLTLNAVDLTSSAAGNGGMGRAGQFAQNAAGEGGTNPDGCSKGGAGGLGGNGGAAGGGAGGISAGIVHVGPSPTLVNVVFELGLPGQGGRGGKPGENDGIDGVAREVLDLG